MATPVCNACGCKMKENRDFPRGNYASEFCSKCVDSSGNLKPRDIIRINMIRCRVNELGMKQNKAIEIVDNLLLTLPYWKNQQISAR